MSTYVPFDIQVLIIQQPLLPIKSLIRFISVCKAWKSLITSSEFVAGYRYRHKQPQHLMIKYEVGEFSSEEVKFVCFVDDDTFPQQKIAPTVPPLLLQLLGHSQLVDSSYGLLYLDGYFREPDGSENYMVVLWNPLIQKSISIALPDWVGRPFSSVHGFGVCPHTNDSKIVQVTYVSSWQKIENISCIPNQVMVFALSTGEWTTSSCSNLPRISIEFDTRSPCVIGQFIYWLAYDRTFENGIFKFLNNMIMSFDLSNEEFREVDLPHSLAHIDENEAFLFVYRLKESLAVVAYNVYNTSEPCVVWMMEHGDPKSFTNIFTIEAPHASIRWPLGFNKSGELIFELWDRKDTSCPPVVYEPCSGNIKHLPVRGNTSSFSGCSYTESLLLLDQDDGRIIKCGGAVKRVGTGV